MCPNLSLSIVVTLWCLSKGLEHSNTSSGDSNDALDSSANAHLVDLTQVPKYSLYLYKLLSLKSFHLIFDTERIDDTVKAA